MTTNSARRVAAVTLALAVSVLAACTATSSEEEGSVAAPSNCTPEHEVTTVSEGTLTVAAVDVPPVVVASDGAFDGLEPSLLKKFAEANCLDIKVNTMEFAATIPAIQSGRADIATGGYYRTAARAEVVDLSDPVWLDQMGIVSVDGVDTVDGLAGVKVGTVDGYLWVPELEKVLGDDLTVYPSAVALKADLEAGRVEIAVDSTALADSYSGYEVLPAAPDDRVQSTVQPAQVGFPFTKGNTQLGEALNDAIAQWQSDGDVADSLSAAGMSGELAEVGEPRLIE